jgi:acetolactate synthase-1/2/3 large subunit
MTRIHPADVGIVADAVEAIEALLTALGKHNAARPSRRDELTALKGEIDVLFTEQLAPQMEWLGVLRRALPDDGIYVDELTQVGYVGRVAFPVYQPHTYISTGYQGTLGWGVPTALGVKVAHPHKPVLSIAGDGGFLFCATELATAVQHNIATVTVIFNDGAYGNVRRMQKQLYDNRVIATDLRNPDFVKLAGSFGAQGIRAQTAEELSRAIHTGFQATGPTVIEVPVGEMPSPWSLIHLGRARGKPAVK